MKGSDLKVVAIILAIALFFTIVTSNAVSIASVVMLAKGGAGGSAPAAQGDAAGDQQQGTTPSNGTSTTPAGSGTSTTPTGSGTSTTPTGSGTSTTPTGSGTSTTPTDNGSSSTPAGNNDQPADKPADSGNTDKPAGNNDQPADKPADQPAGPSKEDVFKEYQKAAQEIKTKGNASYNKKEWQRLENLQVGKVGGILQPIIDGYMTTEDAAEVQVTEKGEKSMDRFPACTLTDMSKVASATKEGNVITIIMVDEDTPRNAETSFLGQVTNSILFWEDIENELKGISVIKGYDGAHVVYAGYKIIAEIVDGKFVSLRHEAVANISCPDAKITVFSLPLSGVLYNYCVYDNFAY